MDPAGFFRWILPRFSEANSFHRWLDTSTIAFPGEPGRICDTVAEWIPTNQQGSSWILDVEAQTEPDPDILERQAEYCLRLRRELRSEGVKYQAAGFLLNL